MISLSNMLPCYKLNYPTVDEIVKIVAVCLHVDKPQQKNVPYTLMHQ